MRAKMRRNLWTEEQTIIARRLMAAGASESEFQRALGRSKMSATSRLRWLDVPSERNRANERAARSRYNLANGHHPERKPEVPEHVLAEAVRRAQAPRAKPYLQRLYYGRGILRNRLHYVNDRLAVQLMEDAVSWGADVEKLVELCRTARNWSDFRGTIDEFIDGERAKEDQNGSDT